MLRMTRVFFAGYLLVAWISWLSVAMPSPACAEGQISDRANTEDHTTWPTDIVAWDKSPVDLSFLNEGEKPAGKRGFLRAVKDKLVFEDGTPARFWGTNLTSYALFGTVSKENVRVQTRRLSQLGFNLVRLHHHDSSWADPNVFGSRQSPDTRHLDETMLERLDWWIKCLKDEGIYIWLDLEVSRHFKPADGIDGFSEISKGNPTVAVKGYNYVNRSIQLAMQRFNEAYLNHLNPFTGLRYKDDPAIAALLLTNENDVTERYGAALLPNNNVPMHSALYRAEADAFASKYGLPRSKVWRSWEPGPAKIFLNDLERRFNVTMIEHLRALGVKIPIATTNTWGGNPLSSLPALTAGDLIDMHSYGDAGQLSHSPLQIGNMMHWIAAARVVNRPVSVTEWNVTPFPVPDRHVIPLYLAGSASLQGWDALMQYAYSEQPFVGPGRPTNWDAFNDPGLMATLPAAALLYRRRDVQEASEVYVFAPSEAQLFNRVISPATSVALRTAAEKGKLIIAMPATKELPWLAKSPINSDAKVITDPDVALIDRDAAESVSDTNELRRNWRTGIYTVDTPRSQAAMGRIGGSTINLSDVDIAVTTPSATVAVQSLDTHAIKEAQAILISVGARSIPRSATALPFFSEPVFGRLTIRAKDGLKLHPQGRAVSSTPVDITYENGRYNIELRSDIGTYWLILK